jgi:SWI/SNF-related matrix-associated actin-dependent regulator of chromatin subfamily A-like protein 1
MSHTKPFPYQKQGAAQIERFEGRALLADQMGLGKSLQSLLWCHRNPELRPIIIICPASLKWQWERECRKHFGMRADVFEGTKVPETQLLNTHHIVIINYDILTVWLKYLKRLKPKIIIIDEGHYLCNRETLRFRNVKELCKRVKHIIILTGTPVTNEPANLWPLLRLLCPKLYPAFLPFCEEFSKPELKPWGWVYKGAKNLDVLHKVLVDNVMIRRLKKDVLSQLPQKQRTVIPVEIENRKEYEHAKKDLVSWLGKYSQVKANRARKAQRLVKMGYLKRLAGTLKLKSVQEWIDNYLEENDEKLIVFGLHRAVLHPLHDRYKHSSVLIDGKVKGRDRQLAIDQFLNKQRTRLLFGNIQAAGVGWSAKGVSNTAIIEFPWAPGVLTQAEDRSHGYGRGHDVKASSYYYLVGRETIEGRLLEILQDKQQILDQVLDGAEYHEGLDVYDQLTNELLTESRRNKCEKR